MDYHASVLCHLDHLCHELSHDADDDRRPLGAANEFGYQLIGLKVRGQLPLGSPPQSTRSGPSQPDIWIGDHRRHDGVHQGKSVATDRVVVLILIERHLWHR